MTKYRVEFEVDGDKALEMVGAELLGWAVGGKIKSERVYGVFDKDAPKDPLWEAILKKVDEICSVEGGYRMTSRSAAYDMGRSGSRGAGKACILKAEKRDSNDGTSDVFLIEAYTTARDGLRIKVDGPFTDSNDQYWANLVGYPKAIITPDWVHRTVSKDDPEAVRLGGGGHGGAEFQFKLLDSEDFNRFRRVNLNVEYVSVEGDYKGEESGYILTTHNCWYQGVIPPKHRHLFKVNAEMVKGFNPGRNG